MAPLIGKIYEAIGWWEDADAFSRVEQTLRGFCHILESQGAEPAISILPDEAQFAARVVTFAMLQLEREGSSTQTLDCERVRILQNRDGQSWYREELAIGNAHRAKVSGVSPTALFTVARALESLLVCLGATATIANTVD